jgi:hypothetical protein
MDNIVYLFRRNLPQQEVKYFGSLPFKGAKIEFGKYNTNEINYINRNMCRNFKKYLGCLSLFILGVFFCVICTVI